MTAAALPKIGHWTPSRISLLDECAFRFEQVYIAPTNEGGGFVEDLDDDTEDADVGSAAHRAYELAAGAGLEKPDATALLALLDADKYPLSPEVLGRLRPLLDDTSEVMDLDRPVSERYVERPMQLTVDGIDVRMRIDRIDVVGDDVTVIDYKFGDYVQSRADLEWAPAPLLYLRAAREEFPLARRIRGRWWWLKRGLEVHIEWTPELDARAVDIVRAATARARPLVADSAPWPARLSGWCKRCPFRARCPAYQKAIEREPQIVEPVGALVARDPAAAVTERARLAAIADLAEARRKEIDAALRPLLLGRNVETPEGLIATLTTQRRPDYPDHAATVAALAAVTKVPAPEITKALVETALAPGKLTEWIRGIKDRDLRELAQEAAASTAAADIKPYVTVRRKKIGTKGAKAAEAVVA